MPRPLPGFHAPAAGFDEPLAMLHACHDRVRRSLDLLGRLCERVMQGRVDAAVHDAAADVLRYFDRAAPQHHEDEERHVFPHVLAAPDAPAAHDAVRRLQQEHLQMQATWAQLRGPLAALAAGDASAFGAAQVDAAARFRALYEIHAQTEESLVFPLAERLLDEREWRAAGAEMAARRGVVPPQGNGE